MKNNFMDSIRDSAQKTQEQLKMEELDKALRKAFKAKKDGDKSTSISDLVDKYTSRRIYTPGIFSGYLENDVLEYIGTELAAGLITDEQYEYFSGLDNIKRFMRKYIDKHIEIEKSEPSGELILLAPIHEEMDRIMKEEKAKAKEKGKENEK